MKSITVKINIPKEIREILLELYTPKDLERELRDECQEFMWDIFHAITKYKSNLIKEKLERERAA